MAGVDQVEKGRGLQLVVLTAPGVERLPWDPDECVEEAPHRHAGPAGCRVRSTPLKFWEAALPGNWRRGHQAASNHVRRLGHSPAFVGRINEPQQRGPSHLNLLLEEGPGARAYQAWWVANGPRYGFGYVDSHNKTMRGPSAVAYLCSYLTPKAGGSKRARGTDICAAAGRAGRYQRVWSISPRLTKRSGVTMSSIRRGREVWAAKQGFCPMPTHGLAVLDWHIVDCETGEISHRVFAPAEPEPPGQAPKAESR
jgi:hypothetical protein